MYSIFDQGNSDPPYGTTGQEECYKYYNACYILSKQKTTLTAPLSEVGVLARPRLPINLAPVTSRWIPMTPNVSNVVRLAPS